MENSKKIKLSLKKITLQNLTDAEKLNVVGGLAAAGTQGVSECLSCSGRHCSSSYCYTDRTKA